MSVTAGVVPESQAPESACFSLRRGRCVPSCVMSAALSLHSVASLRSRVISWLSLSKLSTDTAHVLSGCHVRKAR